MVRVAVCVVLYAALAAAVWFGLGSLNMPRFRRLAADAVPTNGRVTATDCPKHGTVHYAFDVDGREVTSAGLSPDDGRRCDELRPGDRVTVWYIPADPTASSLRDPQADLANETLSVGVVAAVFPVLPVGLLAAVLWLMRRNRQRID
jgi:hypothetical protein